MKQVTTHTAARIDGASGLSQPTELRDLAASFKLLSDETRLRVLSLLIQSGELNVRTLCSYLDQSQPAVSHHLALLRDAGVVEARRDGKHNFYRCISGRLEALIDSDWRGVMKQADCDARASTEAARFATTATGASQPASQPARHGTITGQTKEVNGRSVGHEYVSASTPQVADDALATTRADSRAATVAESG